MIVVTSLLYFLLVFYIILLGNWSTGRDKTHVVNKLLLVVVLSGFVQAWCTARIGFPSTNCKNWMVSRSYLFLSIPGTVDQKMALLGGDPTVTIPSLTMNSW